jgi:threonine/homoserine/homoserine lactone efflux protein
VSRLRAGEWTAAAGAAGLLVTLFLPWFGLELPGRAGDLVTTFLAEEGGMSGWDTLGLVVIVLALAAIGCAAWLAIANAGGRPVAQAVAASVLTATVGTLAFVALALRALVFQPGPNEFVTVRYGAWLGLLAALALAFGGWWATKDERTGAPESVYTPPEPRPAPPPRLTGDP